MLRNERYAGVLAFGRFKNDYDEDGNKARAKQSDASLIIRTERPDLRIIPHALWAQVQKRISAVQQHYLRTTQGLLHGRPVRGLASRYLLSGLLRCGCCGSNMVASSQYVGSGATRKLVKIFLCNYRSHRGPTACSNALRPPMEALDREVTAALEQQILNPERVRRAVKRALALAAAAERGKEYESAKVRRALAQLEAERTRLVAAIRMGGGLEALVEALKEVEQRIEAQRGALAQHAPPPSPRDMLSDKRLERTLTERLGHLRSLLAENPEAARGVMRLLIPSDSPILFLPDATAGGFKLRGATRLGALFESGSAKVASPRSAELGTIALAVPLEA
jgi:site-specific DNA recombinase